MEPLGKSIRSMARFMLMVFRTVLAGSSSSNKCKPAFGTDLAPGTAGLSHQVIGKPPAGDRSQEGGLYSI
ncbi:MAG: hypothetical protein CMF59_11960 [Leptospiraceae bacterium]|nr:hypothetical protein [Leptospiraceae bacterium]